ncbi:MAG: PD40 domain-containing protein, partial [Acidobacteria bacterium]|nr:PD40 domain-containing protein [Acidobacteriota bacterium]
MGRAARVIALSLAIVLLVPVSAGAQYFGRNKVRYEQFDFQILQTPHFDIYYYPAEQEAVSYAAHLAERWYARLSRALDHEFRERQPIVLYASHTHFTQTTIVSSFIGEGVSGLTEHQKGRVVMPFAAGLGETSHVLGHELVHAFQRDILRTHGRSIEALPLWFLEGMAEYLAAGHIDPHTAMWLRDAVADARLPTLEQLDEPRWFPYRYGQALWAYLADRFGEDVVVRALKSRAKGGAIGRIAAVTQIDSKTLSKDWHQTLVDTMRSPPPAAGEIPGATPIVSRRGGGGRLNVAPAISPDGEELVFLSERDRYSIDVYLADASTGAVKRRLVRTAADPHFDSLQFIASAGAWDPAGTRFALATVQGGKPVITIIEMSSGRVQREILVEDVDQVFSPSWSPDGQSLVFSGLKGGLSDLYVVDLDTRSVRALMSDPFADLQPSWSPDGRTIAFATDRFTSSLESLTFGEYRLGAFDLASGAMRELPGIPDAKHIDPHWSADGRSLYFVADPDECSNVYRLDVPTGEFFQITHVESGVSGITAISPALSMAAGARRIAFSVYRHGAFQLHVSDAGSGTAVASRMSPVDGASSDQPRATAESGTPGFGVFAEGGVTVKPYKARLSLHDIGQPYLSAGGGSLGTFVRAGVQLSFGDMLREHSLHTALQVGKRSSDFAVQTAYLNRRSRWNWVVFGEQVPSGIGISRTSRESGGANADQRVIATDLVFQQIHRQVGGIAIYPFSRARRVEFTGTVHAITFRRDATTSIYTKSGRLIEETREGGTAGRPVRLIETGAALVYDAALVGPTSPILGSRYRVDLAPTVGDLTFATVIADYRRYWMPARPFTLAFRVKHVGRYGPGAGDARLLPLAF